ncbi:MAG: phage terminase large subunit family protein [Pirellulales bacterium]|nr:phage terminase large subunit family protein [Pirellulales bacterium]
MRGLNKKNQRPQVVGIDDPDTEETVNNVVQANKLEARIDRGIGGLGGQQRGVARIMLTTLQSRDCASAWFTDPERKPSWKGRRFKFLLNRPENIALWEEYMQQRQEDQRRKGEDGKALDPNARRAHQFYLDHRAEMDRGAKVANEHRFNGQVLPDGTQLEVSALQRYFNEVARIGWEAVATEYDNDPPEQSGPQTDGISAALVMSRVNGREQRILPRDTIALTAAIDIGKYYCHWVVTAWREQAIGCVVDYGIAEVVGVAKNAAVETVERAIYRALLDWRHQRLQEPYYDDLGEIREMDAVLVDSGDYRDAVYSFIRDVGGKPFLASKGIGSTFREHAEGGSFWNVAHQPDHGIYLYTLGSDHWKRWVHERFLTPTFDDDHRERPGSLSLWTPTEPRKHQSYAHHIVAEEWREDFKEGRGVKKYWHKVNANNHWLDATYMACAAANMCGVTLMPSASPQPLIPKPSPATVERFVNPTGLPYLLTER